MRETWPLGECLSGEALEILIQYQWDTWGERLEIIDQMEKEEKELEASTVIENTEEISRLMKQTRRSFK